MNVILSTFLKSLPNRQINNPRHNSNHSHEGPSTISSGYDNLLIISSTSDILLILVTKKSTNHFS